LKTLERYVFGAFLSSFLLAFVVLTFVLTIGLMVQIVGYILDGIPMSLIGEFAMVSFPETLQWTMPLALLVASVLVFSRMSADSEIAAMRACGVHLLTIMRWPLVFAGLCTLLGFAVNNEIVPRGHEVRRTLKTRVSVDTGLEALEPGRVISDFPKIKLYFGSKDGNWLHDVVAIDYSDSKGVPRHITAAKALVRSEGRDILLDLYQMTVDPIDADHPTMARAGRFQYVMKDALSDRTYTKRDKDYRLREAMARLEEYDAALKGVDAAERKGRNMKVERDFLRRERSNLAVELSKRFVFAMASVCFVLIGIPLGIRAQRRESTIGMAISLATSLVYYMVVILMLGLQDTYSIHPEWLIWLAPAMCLALAARLVPRNL